MQSLWASLLAIPLLSLAIGCSGSESVNRRGETAASVRLPGVDDPDDRNIQTDPVKSTDFTGPRLTEAKNTAAVSADFKAGVLMLNKISANQIVLFGKDGKSWLYNPAAETPPTQLDPLISPTATLNVYTLPDSRFWVVGSDKTVGRRKAGDTGQGTVTVEKFNTAAIKGDWTKVRVLYAAADTIILNLDTDIAILAIRNGTPSLSQFSSKLPIIIDGSIVAAGETESGGYWFAGKETVALLELSGLSLSWTRAKVPMTGHEDYSQLAMRIDSGKKEVTGDVLMFQGDKYWSVTGAAIQ